MEQYHSLLKQILSGGKVQFEPRTQEYILGLGGAQSIYPMENGFPLMTTKNVPLRLVGEELFWKMRGDKSVKPLFDRDVHIWDENAFQHWLKRNSLVEKFPKHTAGWESKFKEYCLDLKNSDEAEELGDLGPVYGYQWRHGFERGGEEIDQLARVIKGLKDKPGSRYHVISAWNPSALPDQALGPCPMIHQFSVFGNELNLNTYQRSCDAYLGVPFNIAQESLMLEMVAKEVKLPSDKFIHSYGNVHVYLGVPPRAEFWTDPKNVIEFKDHFCSVDSKDSTDKFLGLRDWYLETAPPEDELNKGKDHIPYILNQLSRQPRKLPSLELADIGLWDAINMPLEDVASVRDYNPHKWAAKARMAV